MSNDLHHIDELFRSTLEANEQRPSPGIKESIFANLDKKDAESYRKRFIGWKRIALLLLLVLTAIVIYEASTRKTGTGHFANKTNTGAPVTTGPQYKDKTTTGRQTLRDKKLTNEKENTGNENSNNVDKLIQPTNEENKEANDNIAGVPKNKTSDKLNHSKDKQAPKRIASLATKKVETVSRLSNNRNTAIRKTSIPGELLAKEKINFHRAIEIIHVEKNKALSIINTQNPIIITSELPASVDSLLNAGPVKTNPERIRHFKPYWTFTGLVTYDRLNYKLDSDEPNAITSIKHREVHEPSFSVGILATKQLKEKWGLQTGLIYSHTAIGINPQKIYAFQDPAGDIAYKYITSSGYAYIKPGLGTPPGFGDSILATEAKHTLHSLSVPAIIKYTIGRNKLLFIPGAGIEANYITKAKLEIEIEHANNRETVFVNKLQGTKSFYWSFVADGELRYIVTEKMAFSLRPTFRYAISPITENNVVETFPYSFGAGLGVTYKF
jgi:hypothetical protein